MKTILPGVDCFRFEFGKLPLRFSRPQRLLCTLGMDVRDDFS